MNRWNINASIREVAGLGLIATGSFILAGVALAHQALALPLSDLGSRPGFLPGVVVTAVGILIRLGRRPRGTVGRHKAEPVLQPASGRPRRGA